MSIALEVMPDEGAPQVGITVAGLGAGSAVITVEVSWDSGYRWHGVRGVERVTVTGGTAFFRDFVPPLNVDAVYRLVVHSGTASAAGESGVFVPSSRAWIQDPLDPRSAIPVGAELGSGDALLTAGSFASAQWAQPVDLARVEGASVPVASIGRRMLAGEVPLVLTQSMAAQAGALRRMLLESGSLVIRGVDSPLEPVAHVAVGDVTERRYGSHQVASWDLTVRQVRPTSMRIVVPYWSYEQVRVMWQEALGVAVTYQDVLLNRPGESYLDWQRTPEVP